MGFQIVFIILKIKKIPPNLWAKYIFDYNLSEEVLKECFWHNHKGNYGASFNTPKKHTLMDPFFSMTYPFFFMTR